jgi:hypothetical protein
VPAAVRGRKGEAAAEWRARPSRTPWFGRRAAGSRHRASPIGGLPGRGGSPGGFRLPHRVGRPPIVGRHRRPHAAPRGHTPAHPQSPRRPALLALRGRRSPHNPTIGTPMIGRLTHARQPARPQPHPSAQAPAHAVAGRTPAHRLRVPEPGAPVAAGLRAVPVRAEPGINPGAWRTTPPKRSP